MSRKIYASTLSQETLEKMNTELNVTQPPSKYNMNAAPKYITLYDIEDENDTAIYVPFSYDNNFPRPEKTSFQKREMKFNGALRDGQKVLKKEVIQYLNEKGSVIIAAATGFGKTCTSINLACTIGLKTLIICHRVILVNQWRDSIKKFSPNCTCQVLTAKSKKLDADFYIINAINVPKLGREFYNDIATVLVDECHLIMADKLSVCMRYLVPRFLIGLSATPYRSDGLDILLDMYFGKEKIVRKLFREHYVYTIKTGFKPEVKTNRMGKIDWGSVIESQCGNRERNEMIINLVKGFPDRTFLILCKRVDQAYYIESRLKEEKEDVTSLIGSNQTFEQKSRILVGTVQKTGVGFDHPSLNSLVLASDVEGYFIQYLGRVFRREDTVPFIFDFIDDFGLLYKHYNTRKSVYLEHGGKIKEFSKEFKFLL
jgi:superfamily II DNA or RNA helicase